MTEKVLLILSCTIAVVLLLGTAVACTRQERPANVAYPGAEVTTVAVLEGRTFYRVRSNGTVCYVLVNAGVSCQKETP